MIVRDLERWCGPRETSESIGRAIWELYPGQADRVWEDPSDVEQRRVILRARELDPHGDLCWGVETIRAEAP